MPTNPYQQYFEAQKALFEEWRDYMQSTFFKDAGAAEGASFNPMDYYNKAMEAPHNFWKKTEESYKAYQTVYELWKNLSENNSTVLDSKAAMQIYDEWSKQSFNLLKDSLVPNLPGYIKDYSGKFLSEMEATNAVMSDYFKNWSGTAESLKNAFFDSVGKGPKGYIDLLDVWRENYDKTFGKLLNAPTFGKEMDFWNRQKSSFDRLVKYNVAVTKFYARLYDIAQDATKQVLEDYVEMYAKGTQPKTFDEFYKYWSKKVSEAYQKVLFSDDISALAGNLVDAMSAFKIEFDQLCEMYLAAVPVPKKSDMDDLYKTVYELKKELRDLKKEVYANDKRNS
ncbi:MAG: hypothetical protein LBN33_10245 [Desulfovibrio sp.]|jgi:class III poly(R)-hydroxyalkanoic acid synthase PhaE subunit|nr:hypothetical protein [Desulfovibrio sp.]